MVPGGDGGHADGVGPPGAAPRVPNIHLAKDGGKPVKSVHKVLCVEQIKSKILLDGSTKLYLLIQPQLLIRKFTRSHFRIKKKTILKQKYLVFQPFCLNLDA
jgi:hypothetical protein